MSTVKTLITGIAVGAVIGVLFAPAKGSKTRRKLMRRGEDIKDAFCDLSDNVNEKIADIKDKFSGMANS